MDRDRHTIDQAHAGAGEEGRAANFLEVRLELRGQGVSAGEAGAKGLAPLFNGNISDKNPPNCSFWFDRVVNQSSIVYTYATKSEKFPKVFHF